MQDCQLLLLITSLYGLAVILHSPTSNQVYTIIVLTIFILAIGIILIFLAIRIR